MVPVAEASLETAKIVMESAEDVREAAEVAAEEAMETAEAAGDVETKTDTYAEQYLSENSTSYLKKKIEAAANNPEVQRSLLNSIESSKDSNLKGQLNEQERVADLSPACKDVQTQVKHGDHRIDIVAEAERPIHVTEVVFNGSELVAKDTYIPRGDFAVECKDGSLEYLQGDLDHIVEQVSAGKDLCGNSYLQITEKNFQDLLKLSMEQQKAFFDAINNNGGKIIIMDTSPADRISAVIKAVANAQNTLPV